MGTRSRWRWLVSFLLGGGLLGIGLASAQPAGAALSAGVITVTTTADEFDSVTPNGQCSLREAIQAVNTAAAFDACPAGAPGDIIQLAAGTTYTLTLIGRNDDTNALGDLDPAAVMTIRPESGRAVITASGLGDRVLDIRPGGAVALTDITVMGGDVSDPSSAVGGGIRNSAVATLTRVDLSDNAAVFGGAIYNAVGGAVSLTLLESNVYSNFAINGGAGIYNSARAVLTQSSVVSNAAGTAGGGFAGGVLNDGTLTLRNVTISGNEAGQGGGGGLYNQGAVSLNNVTISANATSNSGGGILNFSNSFEAMNSLIVGNLAVLNAPDCVGTASKLTSKGYLVLGPADSLSCPVSGDTTTVITTSAPLLAPLAVSDGRTFTHALLTGSPALDHGNPARPIGSPACEPTDQRGVARIGICDSGAYDTARLVTMYFPLLARP